METNPFIGYIKQRVLKENKNFNIVFVGPSGTGKSYAGLKLAEIVDPTFTIDRLSLKPLDFIRMVNKLDEKTPIPGEAVIWDEFGVGHNARAAMSKANRVINYYFQTDRSANRVVILTVPYLSFVDSATRKMIHCIAEMKRIDRKESRAYVKITMVQTNNLSGKTYYKRFRYKIGQKNAVMRDMYFNLPSKEILDAYEVKKRDFKKWLYGDIEAELNKDEQKKIAEVQKYSTNRPLTPFQELVMDCLKKGIRKQREIADRIGSSQQRVSQAMEFIRKKGYDIGYGGILNEKQENNVLPSVTVQF